MSKVRIEQLPPMRVAYAVAISQSPEGDSLDKLMTWAGQQGLLEGESHRVFGFDNPGPSPTETEYGYETWITVGPDTEAEGEVQVKEFPGGLYAVTSITGIGDIGPGWKQLIEWRENSQYQVGDQPCLEEHLSPPSASFDECRLDLYQPLAE